MQIIQLEDYGWCSEDIIPGVLIQGDIGQIYDPIAFNNFLNEEE